MNKWLVGVPMKAMGVSMGLLFIRRVISYKKKSMRTTNEPTKAHQYCSEKSAARAASAFSGSVIAL